MINHLVLVGKIGHVDKKKLSTGLEVLEFSLATQQSWKDKNNEWQSKTTWHNVKQFSPTLIPEKGETWLVVGSYEQETWEKDGKKHSKHFVKPSKLMRIHDRGIHDRGIQDKGFEKELYDKTPGFSTTEELEDVPF